MQSDPRFRNKTFRQESVTEYFADYVNTLHKVIQQVSADALMATSRLMAQTRSVGGRIFVAGNGGSAAISEHLSCDWQKGVHVRGRTNLKVHCLNSNTALVTAIANDFGYEQTLSFQLELADLKPPDICLLISSSGNSANILEALRFAKKRSCKVIGMSGFDGGKLKEACDISLHVPFDNYGLVEDAHQTLMHIFAQYHDVTFDSPKLSI